MRIRNIFDRKNEKLFSNSIYIDNKSKKFYFLVQDKNSHTFRLVDMEDGIITEEQYSTFEDVSFSHSLSSVNAVLDIE